MKKVLSVLIAAVMLISVFGVNIYAAGTTTNVVGSHKTTGGSIGDGVEEIPAGNGVSSDVVLKVGSIGHRYAVDVTFEDYTFSIANVVWDVSSLSYKTESGDVFTNKTLGITVTNYSDGGITATGTITEPAGDLSDAGISLTMATDAVAVDVAAVTIGNGTDGATVATTGTLSASLTSDDWDAAVNYLIGKNVASYTVGKVTVTIAKTATSETPAPETPTT